MQIEQRAVGSVVILDLKGKITLGEGDEALKDKINAAIKAVAAKGVFEELNKKYQLEGLMIVPPKG